MVHIIPDSFKFGAYLVDRDFTLKKLKRPPVGNWDAAQGGMVRAYDRLWEIIAKRDEYGFEAPLPTALERQAA